MIVRDTAELILGIVKKSVDADPLIQQLPDECHLEVLEYEDGFCEVYIGTHTIFNCYVEGMVTIMNNPRGQYDDYGEVPVYVPITEESIGYAMLYLVQMRMLDERTRKYKAPIPASYVDISPLVPPNKLLS